MLVRPHIAPATFPASNTLMLNHSSTQMGKLRLIIEFSRIEMHSRSFFCFIFQNFHKLYLRCLLIAGYLLMLLCISFFLIFFPMHWKDLSGAHANYSVFVSAYMSQSCTARKIYLKEKKKSDFWRIFAIDAKTCMHSSHSEATFISSNANRPLAIRWRLSTFHTFIQMVH